ncbi:MAG: HDIG domain-containing protein [Deltaproteobacteria bacterium]|nr:HDIG domain-containing protein [Deltaproteobacteria bacterium]MBW2535469.1 HDIG domain-containing protein [Deltaproteobacteria bacterium]
MISRDEALALLESFGPEEHLIHHALESEAIMRGLAERLGRDADLWGLTGLLHDLDYPKTKECPDRHGLDAIPALEGKLPEEALHAIQAHNGGRTGVPPETELDFALRCAETVTGLVVANALVRPGKMEGMKPKSLKKKMKEKAFAANVERDTIRECEKIGLELGEFFQISIDSVRSIAGRVGLA